MPNDNKNQNQSQIPSATPQDDASNPPIIMTDEGAPPMTGDLAPSIIPPEKEDKKNNDIPQQKEEEKVPIDQINPSPQDSNPAIPPSGSAAPTEDIQTSIKNMDTKPKKKFGGGKGKYIATILGIMLLVGGVGAGVILVQQQQNIEEQAGKKSCEDYGSPKKRKACWQYEEDQQAAAASRVANATTTAPCQNGELACSASAYNTNATLPNIPGGYTREEVLNFNATKDTHVAGAYCTGGSCPQEGDTDIAGYYPVGEGLDRKYYPITIDFNYIEEDDGGGSTPTVTASCQAINAYSSTWELLTTTELSALEPSTLVNFCVVGTTSSGTFTKAKFTINTVEQGEITTIRPGSTNEFCQAYTIPEGVATFNVSAQIYHDSLGWK